VIDYGRPGPLRSEVSVAAGRNEIKISRTLSGLTGGALLGYAIYTSLVRTFSTKFIAAWFTQPARAERTFYCET
jgi:hypothetical protein